MMTKKYVVMGVSGCGKSSIGEALANKLDISFYDGDDFHPPVNVEKMQNGIPLTDDDRRSWLETLNSIIVKEPNMVVACSALKPEYRETLRKNCPDLQFIYLKGEFDTIWQRHQKRKGHYFKGASMLESQFNTLIEPSKSEALYVDISNTPEKIIDQILQNIDL
ncbi:gluconokinase [Vibrio sp. F74]|uniref:gluconokinase n=1 Tax=Vibrio sp. F74 TaxID=700020 RepID=UPI0035F546C6